MKKIVIISLLAALLGGSGIFAYRQWRLRSVPIAVWRCLHQAQQMTLYSIHPQESESALVGSQLFHGYRILGQVPVSAPADQKRVAQAVQHAVLVAFDSAACFNPRQGVRVSDGRDTYDLVICFECGEMEIFAGEERVGNTGMGGSPDALNSILTAGGVPLADPHES